MNGLLVPSHAALAAAAGVDAKWMAAIQNAAASALTMLSLLRLSIGCALVGRPELERRAFAQAWPLAGSALAILLGAAALAALRAR